jgi:hypothetical protein
LVGVPLIGGGGGHGWIDWWPRFETRAKEEVYLEFQHSAEQWSDLIARFAKMEEVDPESRRKSMLTAARALKALLDRQVAPYQDPEANYDRKQAKKEWPTRLRVCVEDLIKRLVDLEPKTNQAVELDELKTTLLPMMNAPQPVMNAAPETRAFAREAEPDASAPLRAFALLAGASELDAGMPDAGAPDASDTENPQLRSFVAASDTGDSTDASAAQDPSRGWFAEDALSTLDELASSAEELRGLVDAYRQLSHSDHAVRGRHNYLLGPAVMIPIQDIAREWMYGVVLEAGVPAFRFTASGGFRVNYDNRYVVAPTGWYAGVGVSGEFADDFFHWANGAQAAATKLRSEIVGEP